MKKERRYGCDRNNAMSKARHEIGESDRGMRKKGGGKCAGQN